MTAINLLKTLIVVEPAMNELESANNVLNELHRVKSLKGTPYFAIRRAIRIQERIIKKIN